MVTDPVMEPGLYLPGGHIRELAHLCTRQSVEHLFPLAGSQQHLPSIPCPKSSSIPAPVLTAKRQESGFQKQHKNAEEKDKLESPLTDQLGEDICFIDEITQIFLNNTWFLVKETNPTAEKYISRPGSWNFCQIEAERAKPAATATHSLS